MAREAGCRRRRSRASGARSACSRTGRRPSSSPAIRCSSRRCATSSGCTWIRRSRRWCCAWTRRARSRRSTARSRSCRWPRASPSGAPTTTRATARRRSLRRWTSPPARSSARCTAATAAASSCSSCAPSRPTCRRRLDIHLVMDNYGTHKTPTIRDWFARNPRFHVHFTPTSASWLNQVERWFATLTQNYIRRGTHRSTRQLEQAIRHYLERQQQPTPSRSCGPRPPMTSSPASSGFVCELLTHDTRRIPIRSANVRPSRTYGGRFGYGPVPPTLGQHNP